MKTTSNKPKQTKNLLVPITFLSTTWRVSVIGASENKHTKGIMKKIITAIALAAVLPALTTLAQPGPGGRGQRGSGGGGPGGPGGHHPPPSPVLIALDANGDGVIDAQEIANAPAALAALDQNGDGKLTPDELRPQHPDGGQGANNGQRGRGHQQQNGGGQGKHPLPPLIRALDTNGDGTLDAQEIANASTSLKALDANGDGQLSFNEFCPAPPDGGSGPQQ